MTRTVLLVATPGAVRDFQTRLASTFHVHTPVVTPGGEWTVHAGLPWVVERSADGCGRRGEAAVDLPRRLPRRHAAP